MILDTEVKNKKKSANILCKCDKCGEEFYRTQRMVVEREFQYCRKCICQSNGAKAIGKSDKKNNPTYKLYWQERGYSEEEISLIHKQKKTSSKEYWINKGYSEEEAIHLAKNQKDKMVHLHLAYWINKGYSEEEAKKIVEEKKKEHGEKIKKKSKGKLSNVLSKDHWINKGCSEEEAIQLALDAQHDRHAVRDNKKIGEKLKEYYKKPENQEIIKERAKRQKSTMLKFKKTHSPIFKEYWINKGYSEEEAKNKVIEVRFLSNGIINNSISKIENKFFDELYKHTNIDFKRNKYMTINKRIYAPDGRYQNIIIEFYGTNIHLDERFHDENSNDPFKRTFLQVKTKDKIRASDYLSKYNLYVIWEYDFNNNKDLLLNTLKERLGNENFEKGILWDSRSL